MGGTQATSSDGGGQIATLADAVERDDDRDCPHDCHGNLTVAEDGQTVVCWLCRCTPDGVYIEPPRRRHDDGRRANNRVTYRISGRVRLAGGFEPPYSERDERRPDGVTADYTFDLTTHKAGAQGD